MLIRYIKKNQIQIGVILLILVMAVLNFVMIPELPSFVSSLQIKGKVEGPRHILPFEDKAIDTDDGSAKYQIDPTGKVVDNPVYILNRGGRHKQGLRK